MNLALIINTDEPDLSRARVVSTTDLACKPLPSLCYRDQIAIRITLIKSDGSVHAASGDAAYEPRLSLGVPGFAPLAECTEFTPVEASEGVLPGWQCVLDLDEDLIALFLRNSVQGAAKLVFTTQHETEGRATWCNLPCPLQDAIEITAADGTSVVIQPLGTTPLPLVTALEGGEDTDLDGVEHVQWQVGHLVVLSYGDRTQMFQKRAVAGVTDADADPVTVRCKDYDPAEPYIWVQIS